MPPGKQGLAAALIVAGFWQEASELVDARRMHGIGSGGCGGRGSLFCEQENEQHTRLRPCSVSFSPPLHRWCGVAHVVCCLLLLLLGFVAPRKSYEGEQAEPQYDVLLCPCAQQTMVRRRPQVKHVAAYAPASAQRLLPLLHLPNS